MDRSLEREEAAVKTNNVMPLFIKGGYFDYQIVFITIVIAMFGVVMVYSSSSYTALVAGLNAGYYAMRQGGFALAGVVLMFVISRVNYKYFVSMSNGILVFATLLVLYARFFGQSVNGSSRWINLGLFSFQPSEIAKFAIILNVTYIAYTKRNLLTSTASVVRTCLLPFASIAIIAIENLSTAIICGAIMIVILFVASPRPWSVIGFVLICAVVGVVYIARAGYRSDRITAWLHPEENTDGIGFQIMQSLYAIGSGGLFGKGLGESIQKLGYLPESHNDMIFAIVCEELGLFGGLAVIALFTLLILNLKRVANNTVDCVGGFLVVGIIAHIASQAAINLGVVSSILPPTGVPLPFFSYGGTSLVLLFVEMGIVLAVARKSKPVNAGR